MALQWTPFQTGQLLQNGSRKVAVNYFFQIFILNNYLGRCVKLDTDNDVFKSFHYTSQLENRIQLFLTLLDLNIRIPIQAAIGCLERVADIFTPPLRTGNDAAPGNVLLTYNPSDC